jgi:hypothetical protein
MVGSREQQRGNPELQVGADVGGGYGSTSYPGKGSLFFSSVAKASRSSIVGAERHPYPELSSWGMV